MYKFKLALSRRDVGRLSETKSILESSLCMLEHSKLKGRQFSVYLLTQM